ncbi:MAG: hypothetical protein IKC28_09715 [Clostridia bacterium]|nr:hypothetical protein [Clostridia bacterium]
MKRLCRIPLFVLVAVVIVLMTAPVNQALAFVFDQTASIVNAFVPDYSTPESQEVSVTISITQNITQEGSLPTNPAGFLYQLMDVQTGQTAVATTGEDGRASFQLTFQPKKSGEQHSFVLSAIKGAHENIVCSDRTYQIRIDLIADENGWSTLLAVDGEITEAIEVAFVHSYLNAAVPSPLPPHTYDESFPGLCCLLLLSALMGMIWFGLKTKEY